MNVDFKAANLDCTGAHEFEAGEVRGALRMGQPTGAGCVSSEVANRTHRVVRERAKVMRARRSQARSLWIPLLVCAGLLVAVCSAVWSALEQYEWSALDQYEVAPTGFPDASQQLLVLMMWSLPLSGALLALVWFRRARTQTGDEAEGENSG
jgi:hypothetical protein